MKKIYKELNNFDIRQSLEDHDSWVQSVHILQNGLSGNYIDNAGNFGNQMLNQITSIALEGYQNARDAAYGKLRELRNKVEALKKDTGYAGLVEHTYGNQTSLYEGMTYYDKNGNLIPSEFENKLVSTNLHFRLTYPTYIQLTLTTSLCCLTNLNQKYLKPTGILLPSPQPSITTINQLPPKP